MQITAIYASLLGFLLLFLSIRIIKARRLNQISIGDDGNEDLKLKIRTHANFIEYTPIALILLACTETLQFIPMWSIHVLGIALFLGRLMHAYGLSNSIMFYRVKGMQATFAVILLTSLASLIGALSNWF